MRHLLADRDARLLLAGQTLSAFGDWAMLIVLAVWMKALTGSSALAGLTFFTFVAGSLLAPLGGLLADRVRRRPLMIVSDCVLGAFVLVLLLVHDRGLADHRAARGGRPLCRARRRRRRRARLRHLRGVGLVPLAHARAGGEARTGGAPLHPRGDGRAAPRLGNAAVATDRAGSR